MRIISNVRLASPPITRVIRISYQYKFFQRVEGGSEHVYRLNTNDFIGYWFWGAILWWRPELPTLGRTLISPIGVYMVQGIYGFKFGGHSVNLPATPLEGVASILVLIGIGMMVICPRTLPQMESGSPRDAWESLEYHDHWSQTGRQLHSCFYCQHREQRALSNCG